MVQIVNAVGSGDLKVELDLERLAKEVSSVEYNPESYHGAFLRQGEGALVILYRTGSYIIRGGDSIESLFEVKQRFLNLCQRKGIIQSTASPSFEVKNLVCTSDLSKQIDLNTAVMSLGLELTEYEPEQFPGLIYRPRKYNCTILVFGSGKIVITGEKDIDQIESAINFLGEELRP